MAKDDSNGFGAVRRPNNDTRIRYVEPNDIYGEINGVPTTPESSAGLRMARMERQRVQIPGRMSIPGTRPGPTGHTGFRS